MKIAAVVPTSLSDYPDRVAAVVFTAGCTFRCPFCHNPDLVLPDRVSCLPAIDLEDVICDLTERSGFLDGVVVTGGEPTMHDDLPAFLTRLRDLELLVKLDTNGSRPAILKEVLSQRLVDYVAMDIKAPKARYGELAGATVDVAAIQQSIAAIREAAPQYEFRTTVAPSLGVGDIEAIAEWIGGASRYVLQPFVPRSGSLVDPQWADRTAMDEAALRRAWNRVAAAFDDGGVRA